MAWRGRRRRFSSFRRGARRGSKYELQQFAMEPQQFVIPYETHPANPLTFATLVCHPRLEWSQTEPGEFNNIPVPPVAKGVTIAGLRHRTNLFSVWNPGGDTATVCFPITAIVALVVLPTHTDLEPAITVFPNLWLKHTTNLDDADGSSGSSGEVMRVLWRDMVVVEAYNGDPFAAGMLVGPQGWGNRHPSGLIRTKSRVTLGMDHGLFLLVQAVNPAVTGETVFLQCAFEAVLAVKQKWTGNQYL